MSRTTMSSRLRAAAFTTVALGAAFVLAPGAGVWADPATDGFWYYDAFHVQDAHDAGLTGKGITIVVVDSPINLEVPTLQGADIEVLPSICYADDGTPMPTTSTDFAVAEHGTNIASYLVGTGKGYAGQTGIKGIVPDAHLIYIAHPPLDADNHILPCFDKTNGDLLSPMAQGINAAVDAHATAVSLSFGGGFDPDAAAAMARAAKFGVVVVASLDNNLRDSDPFPGGYNGAVGVQAIDSTGAVKSDNTDVNTDVVGPGVNVVWQGDSDWDQQRYADGTSIATPVVAGFLGLVAQKYPAATGNQLIQSLIHNTGVDDHELSFDPTNHTGYGVASATHMLQVDPTTYDDVNPLIVDGDDQVPTVAEIDAATETPATGDPTAPPAGGSSLPVVPIIIGAAALLVIIVIVIIIVVIASSKKNRGAARNG
jgi:subtilisin family serine protease